MSNHEIENMLSQLIRMVGNMQAEQQEMKKEQQEMKKEQQEMKKEQQEMKKEQQEMKKEQQEMKREQQGMKNVQQSMQEKLDAIELKGEERHKEILERFDRLERDQDFIWEKTVRNERELGNIKRQLS